MHPGDEDDEFCSVDTVRFVSSYNIIEKNQKIQKVQVRFAVTKFD